MNYVLIHFREKKISIFTKQLLEEIQFLVNVFTVVIYAQL